MNDDDLRMMPPGVYELIARLRRENEAITADRDLYRAALRCHNCNGTGRPRGFETWPVEPNCPACRKAREKARGA